MRHKATIRRCNLHDELGRHSYDHAVICTYTFDFDFFEEYCLDKFKCFQNNRNITIITDRNIYQEAISDTSYSRPRYANIRYLLHPVSVRGRFHPKIYLFVSKDKGKLIFGSANFTRAGITSNAEFVSCYEYDSIKNVEFQWLFLKAFHFIKDISNTWPTEALNSNLNDIERNVPWLGREDFPDNDRFRLFHNLEIPLWEQIKEGLQPPVDRVRILSRFFDPEPALLSTLIDNLKPKEIFIYTQNGTTTLSKRWFEHKFMRAEKGKIFFCDYKDGASPQSLHAKAIYIEKGRRGKLIFGSANFTKSALVKTAENGNVEFIAALSDIKTRDIDIDSLFDPIRSAILAVSPKQLLRGDKDNKLFLQYEINIYEAQLRDNTVWIRWSNNQEYINCPIRALITFHDNSFIKPECAFEQDGWLSANVSKEAIRRLNNFSAKVQIEAFRTEREKCPISNPLLIANLMDIHSGQSIRKTRYINEAQQSLEQFTKVLSELLRDFNEDNLLLFFNYCDIPFIDDKKHRFTSRRQGNFHEEGMRKLGEHNLKFFSRLHEAAMDFLKRHLRKLIKHCESCSLYGVYNFLHIFLAMGDIIHTQVARALNGFEATATPLSVNDWANYRDQLECYYDEFGEMMHMLWNDYLSNLLKFYPRGEIQDRIGPDINQIRELCTKMNSYRERMEALRLKSLRVRNPEGILLVPEYFSCVFDNDQWPEYREDIFNTLMYVENTFQPIQRSL